MTRFDLTRNDFSLSDDEVAVQDSIRGLLSKRSGSDVVRSAEPLGHDPDLWAAMLGTGFVSMGVPVEQGGDGASLVDLTLVAEQVGAFAAPVPLVSQVVTARLLARAGQLDLAQGVMSGRRPIALAPRSLRRRQLVPDAALVRDVVGFDDGLVLLTMADSPSHVANQGSTPLAWVDPSEADRLVLVEGGAARDLFDAALAEWKLLMAAALVGLTDAAMWTGVEFAKSRETMGVPIGALQGVAFQLSDIAVDVGGTRNLVRKAAWLAQHRPGERPELVSMAFATAGRIATQGTYAAAHVQGGLGFCVESDVSLYFLRAKGWSVLMGDPTADYLTVGDILAARA